MTFRISPKMIHASYTYKSNTAIGVYRTIERDHLRFGDCRTHFGFIDENNRLILKRKKASISPQYIKADYLLAKHLIKLQKNAAKITKENEEKEFLRLQNQLHQIEISRRNIFAELALKEPEETFDVSIANGSYYYAIIPDKKNPDYVQFRICNMSHFYVGNGQPTAFLAGELKAIYGHITEINAESGTYHLTPSDKLTYLDIFLSHMTTLLSVGISKENFFKLYRFSGSVADWEAFKLLQGLPPPATYPLTVLTETNEQSPSQESKSPLHKPNNISVVINSPSREQNEDTKTDLQTPPFAPRARSAPFGEQLLSWFNNLIGKKSPRIPFPTYGGKPGGGD